MTVPQVYLVGAGPGDPELLTLKAVRTMALADVALVDDLVNPAILAHLPARARVIHVGKRGGCASTPQAFIEKLMVAEARRGHTVVRLKGGDPFVFGRGGEEIAALDAAGIRWTVVNGITAGIAAPAAAGIPVTHRDAGHGVAFVTGHTRAAQPVNWRALAQSGLTLVVYMGISRSEDLQRELLAGGLSPATPVAAIQHATLPQQRVLRCTLGVLTSCLTADRIGSPAILVIGEVAAHAGAVVDLALQAARANMN